MRSLLPFVLVAAALLAAATPCASTQTTPQQRDQTASERSLVEGSREAIIRTGVSAEYFDRHFSVERVVDRPGDRRVVWLFTFGGHRALVGDSVGFYTEGGRRIDTHSVAATLSTTSELTRAITRARAERIMRRCIGPFSDPRVEYRAHGDEGRAALLLTAHAVVPPRRESPAVRARREKAEREAEQARDGLGRDQLRRRKGPPGPVILLGAVDLVTGECTVGHGQAGAPKPAP